MVHILNVVSSILLLIRSCFSLSFALVTFRSSIFCQSFEKDLRIGKPHRYNRPYADIRKSIQWNAVDEQQGAVAFSILSSLQEQQKHADKNGSRSTFAILLEQILEASQ